VRAYAQFVDRLGGRYLTAEDVGTTQADMDLIRTVTPHVTGISESLGGSGDPSPATAWGVYHALLAVAERRWGDASLADLHVAIAGTGKVGSDLARRLAAAGCRLTLADVRDDVVVPLATELRADIVEPDRVHAVVCDVFSPCALGATLNERTIPELQCAAICGCANNQRATDEDGDRLADAGVLYAPDYVANAGGVINIADELGPSGYDRERAYARVATIEETVRRVFDRATADGVTPARAADRLAEERLGVSRQPS
jgi:leucine dehydrogenase